jgi:thiol-disulfide isomerase/thioredoxin
VIALRVLVVVAAVGVSFVGLGLWRRPPRLSRVEPSAIGASGAAIVQFGTTHCAPCKQARPVLEQTARETGVEFVDVDLEERPDLASRYGIRSVPVIVVTDERGEVLGRWPGLPPDGELHRLAFLARAA